MKFLIALLLALPLSLFAEEKLKKFDLGKQMEEQVFLCLKKDIAIALVDAAAKNDRETLSMLSQMSQQMGDCGVAQVGITYKKQVYKKQGDTLFTVYEAVVGEVTVYVPLKGYEHRGDI